jgi:hypothetical protein
MADTLGTDAGNLTGQGGAVTNTAGDVLLGTDNEGEKSYALGPSLSRAIETGVINGDFGTPPPELSTNIDNAENALPYFTTEVSHTDATAPYVQAVSDVTAASGQVLRFTIPSGAAVGRYARIVRYVAVPGSAARTWTNQPRAAWRNATGGTLTQAAVVIRAQYYQNDGTTTTGTQGANSKTFAQVAAATYAYETQANPNVTGAIPTDGAYLKIEVGVEVSVETTSEMTVDLTEVRYDRGLIQLLLADQVDPSAYGYGVIYLNNGTMWIRANELGASGSNPTIYLSGSTGNIIIDPTSTGTAQVLGSASATGDVTAVNLRGTTAVWSPYLISEAGTSSTLNLRASSGLVALQDSNVANGTNPRITFYDKDGTAYATVKSGAGNVIQILNGASATDYAQLWAERIYPMNGSTASRYMYDDGTRIAFSSGIDAAGSVVCSGAMTSDSISTTTQTASAAIWVLTSGSTYNLRRNSSSARYKTNIVDADAAVLAAARNVHPRHYESTIEDEAGATRLGFIAEEVHDAGLTHAVGYDAEGRPESLDTTALIAALWKRVEDLEERLAALEGA